MQPEYRGHANYAANQGCTIMIACTPLFFSRKEQTMYFEALVAACIRSMLRHKGERETMRLHAFVLRKQI